MLNFMISTFRGATRHSCRVVAMTTLSLIAQLASPPASAEETDDYRQDEFPKRPTPEWVRMVDLGATDPRLKGIEVPEGISVEIVAEQPAVVDPVGITFDNDGSLYVLEWRVADTASHSSYEVAFQDGSTGTVNRMTKSSKDELKRLIDSDGDGVYDSAKIIMNDLEIPSSLLIRDGWFYFPSVGHVIRRSRSQADGPFDVEEEILRGLCGFHHHQVSGLAISHDGWMYVTSGDDDNRAEGSDGSRATVLRTGAIFRCRPDGSHVLEFARGFRNPYRNVVFDEMYNMFHVDNDQEDGSKFQGVRLMHLQEGADYGWRLLHGAVCCKTDFVRGAVFGESPGKMPAMLKTGRGAPAGLLIYQGTCFPDFFRGLLIYPDVFRKTVRAYRIERKGSTFTVVQQFELMRSQDGLFRPCHAVQGPDGAIYIVDWRTDSGGAGRLWGDAKHGRIYRLRWDGNDAAAAIPLQPRSTWSDALSAKDDELWQTLRGRDFELRARATDELCRRANGNPHKLLSFALDTHQPTASRICAMGGACRFIDNDVVEMLGKLLSDPDADIRRSAATAMDHNCDNRIAQRLAELLLNDMGNRSPDDSPAALRAKALALGSIASRETVSRAVRDSASVILLGLLQTMNQDVYLHDGILRGIERLKDAGMEKLLGLLDSDDPRQQELGISAFESLRTRPAAKALDRLLPSKAFASLNPPQKSRLVSAYRHILVEPPIDSSAVVEYLEQHPSSDVGVKVAALETIGLVGGVESNRTTELAVRLLAEGDPDVRKRVIDSIGNARLTLAARPLVDALADNGRDIEERRAIINTLSKLRSIVLPFTGVPTSKGVENVVNELRDVAADPDAGALRADALTLLANVDFELAKPVAYAHLEDADPLVSAGAVNVLGSRSEEAKAVARRFTAGSLPKSLLPNVAEGLRRHVAADSSGEIAELIKAVFVGGLLVSNDPKEVARVEELVKNKGDAKRGLVVYKDRQKSQCFQCHQLEGAGGQVGPDLTKVYETHSVAKMIESIVEPSKEIKEGYATWSIVTVDGQVYTGLKISDDGTEFVLRDANGNDLRIPTGEIEELRVLKTSLMPEGVVAQLSFQELLDLLAFLRSKTVQQGMRQ